MLWHPCRSLESAKARCGCHSYCWPWTTGWTGHTDAVETWDSAKFVWVKSSVKLHSLRPPLDRQESQKFTRLQNPRSFKIQLTFQPSVGSKFSVETGELDTENPLFLSFTFCCNSHQCTEHFISLLLRKLKALINRVCVLLSLLLKWNTSVSNASLKAAYILLSCECIQFVCSQPHKQESTLTYPQTLNLKTLIKSWLR